MRGLRIRRPGAWFALAALLAVGAFMLARGAGQAEAPGEAVLVAARAVPAGTLLGGGGDGGESGDGAVALARVPAGAVLPGMLRSPQEAAGRRLVATVAAGEPITQAALGGDPRVGPAPLAAGERAVPVPLRAAGASAAAPVPGARVDVLASDGEGLAGRTRVVVDDAEVLAVMRSEGSPEDVAGDAIVLRLTTDEALEVTRALDFAREVRVVARPAGEP